MMYKVRTTEWLWTVCGSVSVCVVCVLICTCIYYRRGCAMSCMSYLNCASRSQLGLWLNDIPPRLCTGLLLSSGFSSQHQPPATNSRSVSRLSTSEAAEGLHSQPHSLPATVAGSVSMPRRDPRCDVDKPSTETNKCSNSVSQLFCFLTQSWAIVN